MEYKKKWRRLRFLCGWNNLNVIICHTSHVVCRRTPSMHPSNYSGQTLTAGDDQTLLPAGWHGNPFTRSWVCRHFIEVFFMLIQLGAAAM